MRPLGVFRDTAPVPQEPTTAIFRGFIDALTDQPGIRLAQATGRRIYTGGALTPQRFAHPPSEINAADSVRAAQLHMNTRRTLGKQRGQAPGF
jgi:hypothetical protein